ncbi:MAG: ribulose-phosphate 3-epimerase [Parcubacteria group bacterium]
MEKEIIPSILVNTAEEFQEHLAKVESYVDRIHLDITDGIFVPNATIEGYPQLKELETDISIGVHLMVSKPENHVSHWLDTQADKFIFHIEATSKPEEVINILKENDVMVGVALNPETPADDIEDIIDQIDFVHFMTVEPGFYGSDFVQDVIEKIQDFNYMYPDIPIEVDGGITPVTAPLLAKVGVSMFVSGSYIFTSSDVDKAISNLRSSIENV